MNRFITLFTKDNKENIKNSYPEIDLLYDSYQKRSVIAKVSNTLHTSIKTISQELLKTNE